MKTLLSIVSILKCKTLWYMDIPLSECPSVQWKLLNLKKLARQNPQKLQENVENLCNVLLMK